MFGVGEGQMRSSDELVKVENPAWPWVQGLIDEATTDVSVNPPPSDSASCIWALQVTAASTLGALAVHTGGMKVDHGWLRILGGGGSDLPDLATANGLSVPPSARTQPPMLVVGYDVLGGRFALNGGALGGDPGEVNYWGPDTLEWQPIGASHSGWLEWFLSGGLAEFYASLRWPGWEAEVAATTGQQGIAVFPPPFTEQGRDLASASRRVVPFDEILGMNEEFAWQVAHLAPGAPFKIQITDD
jgi:hypothetical protein